MSTGQAESRYSWKSAAWTAGGCILVTLIGWWAGVYKLQEYAEVVHSTQKSQTETTRTLNDISSSVDSLRASLATVQQKYAAGTVEIPPELRGRIDELESGLRGVKENTLRIQDEESFRRTDEAIRRADAEEMRLLGQDLLNNLSELQTDFNERDQMIRSLKSNVDGKRIAASPNHLQRFETLTLVLTPSASDLQNWKQKRTELFAVFERDVVRPDQIALQSNAEEGIRTLKIEVASAVRAVDEDLALLRALQSQTTRVTPAEKTLGDTLEMLKADRATQRLDAVAQTVQQARDDTTAQLKASADELERAAGRVKAAEEALKIAARDADANATATQVNELILKTRLRRQREQLEIDFNRDEREIQSLLHPFITPGIFQPSRDGFDPRYRPEIMSLSAIASSGALEKSVEGVKQLYRVGGSEFTAMRGLGTFPAQSPHGLEQNPRVRQSVERAQELLIKYGALLVEKNMLLK